MSKAVKLVIAVLAVGVTGLLYAGGSFDRHLVHLGLNATECWYSMNGEHVVKCGAEAQALKELKKHADADEKKAMAEAQKEAESDQAANSDADGDGVMQDVDSDDFDETVQ